MFAKLDCNITQLRLAGHQQAIPIQLWFWVSKDLWLSSISDCAGLDRSYVWTRKAFIIDLGPIHLGICNQFLESFQKNCRHQSTDIFNFNYILHCFNLVDQRTHGGLLSRQQQQLWVTNRKMILLQVPNRVPTQPARSKGCCTVFHGR